MKILVMLFSFSPPLALVTFKQPVKPMSVAGWDLSSVRSLSFLPSFPSSFSVSDCIFLLISDYAWKQATLSELSLLLKRAGPVLHELERLERTEKESWPESPRTQLAARPGIFSCLTLTKSLHFSFTHNSEMRVNGGVLWGLFQFRNSVPFYWSIRKWRTYTHLCAQ